MGGTSKPKRYHALAAQHRETEEKICSNENLDNWARPCPPLGTVPCHLRTFTVRRQRRVRRRSWRNASILESRISTRPMPMASENRIGTFLAKQGKQAQDFFKIATKAGITRDA